MSTTRRSKKDIDRFVNQFAEDEVSARGYQVAVLYSEISEYDLAKKYLSFYMTARDNLPQAHKLMAQICEGLDEKEQAIACYKRCLELDNTQKGTILKICEVLSSLPSEDTQRIKYWTEKAEKSFPNNPVVFKLKEKMLSGNSGMDLDKLEELYSKQLEKNYTDASLHVKVMELYLKSDRVQAAVNHGIEVERTLAFIRNPAWYKCLIKAFSAHQHREQGADDIYIHHLFALQNLVFLLMPDHDIVTCATALHQFDQCLFELAKASSQRPKWRAVVTEMEGQLYFLSALLLFKRAQKGQVLWKDASFFATVCLLLSSQYPAIDVKSSWYLQLKQHNKKFFNRLHQIGAYRHSQGGYMVLTMTRSDSVARLQHIKQQLRTPRAREVFYDTLFTLREMREKKDRSYILNSEAFYKVPVMVPSKSVVTQYDNDVLMLYGDNLHVLVWQALQSYNARDKTQPYYELDLYAKLPYGCSSMTNGSPESLSQTDVYAFFCAAVRCAAVAYEDQNKSFRSDSYRPHFLPACLSQPLCSKAQRDWWEAMFKFSVGTARDNFAKSRLTIQQGLEVIRLVGAHGMSLMLVTHMAHTFDKWALMMKQDELADVTHYEALEGRAVFYWKEAMQMLRRLEKNLPYRYPKERLFVDGNPGPLDPNNIAELKEQATFSLAMLDMREGRYEDAKEKLETSKKPMAAFHLAQIFRDMANQVSSDSSDGNDQKKALLERSLDMLYQALDRIQGDPEHELHPEIPSKLDEVVSLLERLQMPAGTSLIDSISMNNNADDQSYEESFSTPKSSQTTPGAGQNGTPIGRKANTSGSWGAGGMEPSSLFTRDSPSFVASNIVEQSTPAPVQRRESNHHIRPSPERLDARIWALEKKLATLIELQEQSKKHWERTVQDAIKGMQDEMRAEMAQNNDVLREIKEFLATFRGSAAGRFVGSPMGPAPFRPPQYYPPQQQPWMPPGNYGYQMSPVPGAPLAPYPGPYPPANRLTPQPPLATTIGQVSHQNDIVEDDIYHIDGEYYEDDGSQPQPHNLYNVPDSQLTQEWPFGHRAGLEGKSTVTYTPPGVNPAMPNSGLFASALRGPSLQYTFKQPGVLGPRLPGSQPQPLPGPGFFSFPQTSSAMFNPQDPAFQMANQPMMPPASQPSALMAALTRSPSSEVTTTTVSMPANVVATACMQAQADLAATGKPGFMGQPQSMVSMAPASTPVPLFRSLMVASKSPDSVTLGINQSPATTHGAETTNPSSSTFGQGFNINNLQTDFASLAKSSEGLGMFKQSPALKSPLTSPVKSAGKHEDDVVEEYEPKVDFKPIIDLPELVEVRTGEEEEEKIFGERAKLFRYDPDTNQWKERGIGEMKLLRHRTTHVVRVLMRREQVLKLCANHKLTTAMKLVPMANSDRAWCWTAMDYAEQELRTERLAVRFKTTEQAHQFKNMFEDCQEEIQNMEQTPVSQPKEADKTTDKSVTSPISLSEMFKPPADSWDCDVCCITNHADARPGANPVTITTATGRVSTGQTLAELFSVEEGSWDCEICDLNNKPDAQKCVACQSLKPGLKSSDIKSTSPSTGGLGGFTFGLPETGGFKFGMPPAASQDETKTTPASSAVSDAAGLPSLSEMFIPATGSWECTGCYVSNKADVQKCVACQALKPGLKPEDVKPAAATSGQGGFRFGVPSNGGYSFYDSNTVPAATSTSAPVSGFKFGMPSLLSATDTKPATVTTTSAPTSTGFSFGQSSIFTFKKTDSTTSSSSTLSTAGSTAGFSFNMSTPAATQPVSSSTPSSTDTVTSKTPGIGSGIAPQPGKPVTFEVPKGGFNFNLGRATTDSPQSASSPTGPATFSFNTEPEAKPKPTEFSFKSLSEQKTPESKPSAVSTGFQFTFTPTAGTTGTPTGVTSPKSPEGDSYYQNKEGEDDHIHFEPIISLPEAVAIVTGEEDDEVLFEHRAKLYRFDKQEWKERGLGNVKILYNKDTDKCRLLMRRAQILKVCCHHYITPDLLLKPMPKTDGKAWIWYAMDFSEDTPNMEQFSIRFKTADIAGKFNSAFDEAREKSHEEPSTPERSRPSVVRSPGIKSSPDEEDVMFVKEEKATDELVAMARKYMLPDQFYLYLSQPACPGCRGCTDSMPGDPPIKEATEMSTLDPFTKTQEKEGTSPGLFGGFAASKLFGSSSSGQGSVSGSSSTDRQKTTDSTSSSKVPSSTSQSTGPFGTPSTGGLFSAKPATKGGLFGMQPPSSEADRASKASGDQSKSTDGGVFGGQATDSVDEFSFSMIASQGSAENAFKKDDSKPFSWSGAGKQLFGIANQDGGAEDGDNNDVVESHDPHFEPIVALPDLVEIKTGEEDFDSLFNMRAKLFRFDKDVNQWKEKGIGEMKILKQHHTGKVRLLLRREQIYKLACNHWLTPDVTFKPLATSETAWCWTTQDFTENEPRMEQFAVRFKNIEVATQFKQIIDKCQKELQENEDKIPIQVSEVTSVEESTLQVMGGMQPGAYRSHEDTGDDTGEEEEDTEEDDDDEEIILFEKRATLYTRDNGTWKILGMGQLKVVYDEDVNGNRIAMETDEKTIVCNHLIAKESMFAINKKKKNCEWSPIDFSTDDPVRREFRAQFSSDSVLDEFERFFEQGRSLAVDSDISERDMMVTYPREIVYPEVHAQSAGSAD